MAECAGTGFRNLSEVMKYKKETKIKINKSYFSMFKKLSLPHYLYLPCKMFTCTIVVKLAKVREWGISLRLLIIFSLVHSGISFHY